MFFIDILVAVLIGVVFTILIRSIVETGDGFLGWLPFFLVFFLIPWAGGLWYPAYGPPILGTFWLAPLVLSVFLFLLFASFLPRRRLRTRREAVQQVREEIVAGKTLSAFFIVMLVGAVVAIIFAYLV